MNHSTFSTRWHDHAEMGEAVLKLEEEAVRAADMVAEALRTGHKVMLCGNGGSASQAMHVEAELVVRMERERGPLPAVALGSSAPSITAAANDYAFPTVFERGVRALGQPGDVLVALSTSGGSENIRRALAAATDMGIHTIAVLGRDGGFTTGVAEIELLVPGTSTARIQEWHLFLLHTIIELAEHALDMVD
ncbi:SIS domain-containing protein [Candidatus Fermentibacteria bacterium]|nr:SIS domain-containing protein [Candidatus Fermentibacteria bacterium]